MRHHVYLKNNAGAWIDVSDRVTTGAGSIEFSIGSNGQPVVAPPADLTVDNGDGWWISAPATVGGPFEGAWEDRLVKFTLEHPNAAEVTIGIFRVATEDGFRANRGGMGTLRLEALAEVLQRADASDVGLGRGYHANIPWTLAVDYFRKPFDSSAMTLPSHVIDYEWGNRGASSLGRPGDFVNGAFVEISGLDRCVDQTYNEAKGVFAFLTLAGDVWELTPATGAFAKLTRLIDPIGYHTLRIFWKRQSSGDGIYIIVGASASGISGYHSPRELAQKGSMLRVWRHDQAAQLYTSTGAKFLVAPVIVRDQARVRDSGWNYPVGLPGADRAVVYGNEYYDYLDTGGTYSSIIERRENLAIPFDQFAYALETRNPATNGVIDSIFFMPQKLRGGWNYSFLNAFGYDSDRAWTQLPLAGVSAEQIFRDSELRAGGGYYSAALIDNAGGYTWTDPASYRSSRTGFRHSIGNGPLLDFSAEHSGGASWDGKFWLACVAWDPSSGWQVIALLITPTAAYESVVATLGWNKLPTFVVCDVTRPSDSVGKRGAIIFGWIDYDSNATQAVGPGGSTYGSTRMARSGIDVYPIAVASGSAALTFSPSSGTVVKFAEKREADTITRQYWPTVGNAHSSGRWTPVAMGFRRYNSTPIAGQFYSDYNCAVSCLDRMELCPNKTGTAENNGAGDPRSGAWTYRLLYLHIRIFATTGTDPLPYATVVTDTYGPGYDVQFGTSLPMMGFSRICQGQNDDEVTNNKASNLFFFNPADRGIYEMRPNDTDKCKPFFRGAIDSHSDSFLDLGRLAVGNEGDRADPTLAGVTHPTFPCTSSEQWADGEYYAFFFGPRHGGRIPLLETKTDSRLAALALATALRDAIFFLNRDGSGEIKLYPSGAPILTLTPSDYGEGTRSFLPIINADQRSIADVAPGDATITTLATPKSRFAATPSASGFGTIAVDVDLKCIASGLLSDGVEAETIPTAIRGRVLWSFKFTGRRVKARLGMAVVIGATAITIEDAADVAVGDLVTLSVDDDSIPIDAVYNVGGLLVLVIARPTVRAYAVGAEIYVDPAGSGFYSDAIRWDDEKQVYRGVAAVLASASAGARSLFVSTLAPFSVGTFFRIHSRTGLDTEDRKAVYIVRRIRPAKETGATQDEIEFGEMENGGGLAAAIGAGDPIGVFLNIPPLGRSARIGQSGILLALIAEQGKPEDETEPPISEGDMIRISYPGLVSKKNENQRVSAVDMVSIGLYGEKRRKRKVSNRFMDRQLALADVGRQVRRYATPKIALNLDGVSMLDPTYQETLVRLEPYDVVRVTDFELLRDRSSYTALFFVRGHVYDPQTGLVKLDLEELDDSAPGSRDVTDLPARVDFSATGDNAEVLLFWEDPPEPSNDGFMIRWSLVTHPKTIADGTLLGIYDALTFSATHSSLTNGTRYYYSLFAKDALSNYSPAAFADATPAADVGNVTALAAASIDGALALTWTDPAGSDVVGFVIRYRTDGTYPTGPDNGTAAGKALYGEQAFTMTGLTNGVEYKVAVFTIDATLNASSGAQVTATPDFNPETWGSCSARYRAHDLRSVGDGGNIDSLSDASGSGLGLIKHADANRPTLDLVHSGYNNLPVIYFNSSITARVLRSSITWTGGFSVLAGASGLSCAFVGDISTTGSGDTFFSVYSSDRVFYWRGGVLAIYEDKGGVLVSTVDVSAYITPGTPTVFGFVFKKSGHVRVYVNGVLRGEDTTSIPSGMDGTATAYFCLGTTQYTGNALQGNIAEVIFLDEANEPALEKIMEKLRAKYAIYSDSDTGGAFSNGFSPGFQRTTFNPFSNGFSSGFGATRKE